MAGTSAVAIYAIASQIYMNYCQMSAVIPGLLGPKITKMIALDATFRKRPNDEKIEDLVKYIHDNNRLAMADCSTYEECMEAERIGFDCVSTTLYACRGFFQYRIEKSIVVAQSLRVGQ